MNIEGRPTPETDSLVEKWDYSPIPKVMEAHARNLERQRDELRWALETMVAEAGRCGWDVDRARATLAATKPNQ